MKKVLDACRRSPFVAKHFEQLFKFAVCGGIGAMIDLGSLTVFVEIVRISPKVAVVPSSLLAITFVFIANKFFTFKNNDRAVGRQVLKFLLVYGIAIALNLAISWSLLWLGVYYLLAKVIAIGTTAVWNYTLSHGFIFRRHNDQDVVVF